MPRAFAQQAHEQAEEARHHGEIIRARRVAHRMLVRVAHRRGRGVVPRRLPRTIDALGRGAYQVQGSEDPVAEEQCPYEEEREDLLSART